MEKGFNDCRRRPWMMVLGEIRRHGDEPTPPSYSIRTFKNWFSCFNSRFSSISFVMIFSYSSILACWFRNRPFNFSTIESIFFTMKKFDAIVIGGGHNGLVCAAYLSKRYHIEMKQGLVKCCYSNDDL
jgi:hypothetical protein